MWQLDGLKYLYLGNNLITQISDSLHELTQLERLFLDSNQLSQLPNLGPLQNLRQIMISDNPLTSLPADIGTLPKLTSLYAGRCELAELPSSLISSSIVSLDLRGNRLCASLGVEMEAWLSVRIGSDWRTLQPQICP